MRTAIRKSLLYGCIGIGVLILTLPFLLNRLANLPVSKKYVAGYINRYTTSAAHYEDFSLTVLPRPGITIDRFSYHGNAGTPVFTLKSGHIQLELLPLFSKKVVIDTAVLDTPVINYFQIDSGRRSLALPAFSISGLKKQIFSLLDTYLPGLSQAFQIEIKNFASPYFKALDGTIGIHKSRQTMTLQARISDVSLNRKDIEVPVLQTTQFKRLDAAHTDISAQSGSNDKVTADITFNDLQVTTMDNQTGFETSQLKAGFYRDHHGLKAEIPRFSAQFPQLAFSSVLSFDSAAQKASVEFNGWNVNLDQLRESSLNLIPSNEVTDHLFDIIQGGACPEITVTFSGTDLAGLFDERSLKLSGRIEDGKVAIPETKLVAESVTGEAGVLNGVLSVQTRSGSLASAEILAGSLDVDLVNYTDFPFSGNFDLDVNLSYLPQTLISLLPGTLLARELEKVNRVEGNARAQLLLTMPTQSDLRVEVTTEPFSASGFYQRIPGPIVISRMGFEVAPDKVSIKNGNGRLLNCDLSDLNAELDFKDEYLLRISSGSARIDLDPVIAFLNRFRKTRTLISPVTRGSGTVFMERMALSGNVLTPDQWEYRFEGTGKDIGLSAGSSEQQIKGLDFSYQIQPDTRLLDNIHFTASGFDWLNKYPVKPYTDQIAVPVRVQEGQLFITPARTVLGGILSNGSKAVAKIDFEGNTLANLSLKSISISDGGLSDATYDCSDGNDLFPCRFSGKLNTISVEKFLDTDSSWQKTINQITAGRQMKIEKIGDDELNIVTRSIDLNRVLSSSKLLQSDKTKFADVKVNFSADQVLYKNLTFRQVNSLIILSPDEIYAKIDEADLCGLSPRGYISYENDWIYTNFPLSAENDADASHLLTCLLGREKFMDGTYSLTGSLSSASHISEVTDSFRGKAVFEAHNGRIYKLTLLSRILSVLNVSNVFKGKIPDITQTGFAYKSIRINCTIKNSVIQLEEAVLDGQDITMIFSGSIDPLNDQIDVTCLVAPFKTVDLIIQKIPIVNTLMSGRLVSVPIKANGSLSDPNVIPLHPSAVGKGLIDMMTNILKAPITLIDKLSRSNAEDDEK